MTIRNELGDLLSVEVRLGSEQGLTLDRDGELGEVAVADEAPELLLGTACRRRSSASCMSPLRQRFTFRWVERSD